MQQGPQGEQGGYHDGPPGEVEYITRPPCEFEDRGVSAAPATTFTASTTTNTTAIVASTSTTVTATSNTATTTVTSHTRTSHALLPATTRESEGEASAHLRFTFFSHSKFSEEQVQYSFKGS